MQFCLTMVARAVKLMALIGQADLHVFSGAGHMVMHERDAGFAGLILDWCRSAPIAGR